MRTPHPLMTAIFLFGLASSSISLAGEASNEDINFLLIFTDDQTFRAIGYNDPQVKTPHLDDLATQGLIFNRAYVASPICSASRASLLTGLFPQEHGVIALNKNEFRHFFQGGVRTGQTLANQFSAAGYRTALFGKSHLGDPRKFGFQQATVCGDAKAFKLSGQFLQSCAETNSQFFLFLAPHKPHVPLKPDQRWLDLYRAQELSVSPNFQKRPQHKSINNQGLPGEHFHRGSTYRNNYKRIAAGPPRSSRAIKDFSKAYFATISQLDHEIGLLVEKLKSLGLYEDTVIVFLSDNGYLLGNHGLGNKITMHEESVRVPLFIHWPRRNPKWNGARTNALVSSLDIFPTLMDLAGIEEPTRHSGKSLLPILNDSEASVREFVLSECVGVGGRPKEGHRMIRSEKWKYVLTGDNEEYLFDEVNDPYELNNLAESPDTRATLVEMRGRMIQWMTENNDREYPFRVAPKQ